MFLLILILVLGPHAGEAHLFIWVALDRLLMRSKLVRIIGHLLRVIVLLIEYLLFLYIHQMAVLHRTICLLNCVIALLELQVVLRQLIASVHVSSTVRSLLGFLI